MAGSAFRLAEKRFRHETAESFSEVIDFHQPNANSPANRALLCRLPPHHASPSWLQEAPIYSIRGVEGFRFVCRALDEVGQLTWARAALSTWPEPPSLTNLQPTGVVDADVSKSRMWEEHCMGGAARTQLSKLAWATLGYHYQESAVSAIPRSVSGEFTWLVQLVQWSERIYDESKRSDFPSDLGRLAADIAASVGYTCAPASAPPLIPQW